MLFSQKAKDYYLMKQEGRLNETIQARLLAQYLAQNKGSINENQYYNYQIIFFKQQYSMLSSLRDTDCSKLMKAKMSKVFPESNLYQESF